MEQVKWGLIGCGNVVENKSGKAFVSIAKSSIYAIWRRELENSRKSAEKWNATKSYDNIDEMLEDNEINAIYIATPPGLHLEEAIKCCKHGKPTYIEKPIGRNYEEAKQIVDIFKKAKIPLYVAHYSRALPKFIKIKEILESGEIGKVCEADFRLERSYNKETIPNEWLYIPELSGGGRFYDIAPHSIDIMVYLLGNFIELHGIASNNNKDYEVEDIVVMSFKTDKGIIGTANFNSVALGKKDEMTIYGTKGKLEFSIHGDEEIIITKTDGTKKIIIDNPKTVQENMIENVIKSLLTGEHLNSCYGEEALETYRIMDMVLEKYYNGRDNDFWNRTNTWNKN